MVWKTHNILQDIVTKTTFAIQYRFRLTQTLIYNICVLGMVYENDFIFMFYWNDFIFKFYQNGFIFMFHRNVLLWTILNTNLSMFKTKSSGQLNTTSIMPILQVSILSKHV